MDSPICLYRNRLNLSEAHFVHIDHEDAIVATVFKVIQPNGTEFILKICSRKSDYLREAYFLSHFQGKILIPALFSWFLQKRTWMEPSS